MPQRGSERRFKMFKKLVDPIHYIYFFSIELFSKRFFSKKLLIKIVYINPDYTKSGFSSIEGIDPENNSTLFKLDNKKL